jgi:thiosulfate reductase cytochrome b subunit
MLTVTANSHEATARADELIAALQAEFAVSERLGVEVGEALHAAASAHLRACLLRYKLAELRTERERWWHKELYAMTASRCPRSGAL